MLAEPGALIGFAGPRVIEQTIGEKLPAGFQRSEFQLEHGFVDQVVPRTELRETLTRILQLHAGGGNLYDQGDFQQLARWMPRSPPCKAAAPMMPMPYTAHAAELAELSAQEDELCAPAAR